jgi:histidinol-phosphate aminotransferase
MGMSEKSRVDIDARRLMRPELAGLEGYEPIEPPDQLARRLGLRPEQIIKLDGNENPYGPSPKALEAIGRYRDYHIYPDPEQREARRAIAAYLSIGEQYIVAGSGSDELIDLLIRAFLSPGEAVIDCSPTFGMYSFLTEVAGGRVIEVPRQEDYSLDVPSIQAAAREAKIVFVASPNNPTGNVIARSELEALLATGLVVVVDEAYVEFSGESFAPLVPAHGNLAVLRTFSKWAGLAGLRAGYGVLPVAVAQALMKIKQPYNLNVAAQAALMASLEDADLLRERVRKLVNERERLFNLLNDIPFLRPTTSKANFILCRVVDAGAKEVWRRLRERGIMVRYFEAPRLRDCLRISVGLPEQTDALIAALKEIGGQLGG